MLLEKFFACNKNSVAESVSGVFIETLLFAVYDDCLLKKCITSELN